LLNIKKPEITKRYLNLSLVIIFVIVLFSCSQINEREDGDWDDNIHLSAKTVEFSADGDSVTIKTGGSWWWITDISVDSAWYYGFKGIAIEAESYRIKQDCFDVVRRDKNTLFIKVEANPFNVIRTITVGLEAGDYFDRVTVTQKSK
jgi:hypothetical protein